MNNRKRAKPLPSNQSDLQGMSPNITDSTEFNYEYIELWSNTSSHRLGGSIFSCVHSISGFRDGGAASTTS